jgi:hypothetical protein
MFQPDVGQGLKIDGRVLKIDPHPAAPKIPYGQEGKQAVVFKISSQAGDSLALKVFKPRYRRPFLVTITERMAKYAELPGMKVCDREIVSPQRHLEILREHPDLSYAAIMPWIEGPTWSEVLLSRHVLSPQESLLLARSLLDVLISLEEKGLSHGDLSGVNIMIPHFVGGDGVSLVDVEQLYIPGMEKPDVLPEGSPGYGFPRITGPLWGPFTDRFPGSIILAEMLCFCDKDIVKASWGESYFSPEEICQDTPLFGLMEGTLEDRYGSQIAAIFRRNWFAESPEDCSPFAEWLIYLPDEAREVKEQRETEEKAAKVKAGLVIPRKEWDLEGLLARAEELGKKGDPRGAIELYEYIITTFTLPDDFKGHITSEIDGFRGMLQAEKQQVAGKEAVLEEADASAYPVIVKPAKAEETPVIEELEAEETEPEIEYENGGKRGFGKKRIAIIAAASLGVLLVIVLLLVFLVGGGTEVEAIEVEIPNLTGLSQEEARALLEESGLAVGKVETQETKDMEAGLVISADPAPGDMVTEGTLIDLLISAEPGKIALPDLAGVDQATAQSQLQGLGLAVNVASEHNDGVAQGTCIRTDPGAGTSLDPGSTVQLIISAGPAPQPEQQQTATTKTCPTCGGSGSITCSLCGGAGGTYTTTTGTCPTCGGNGWIGCSKCGGSGFLPGNIVCDVCGGRGTVVCSTCGGSGQTTTRVLVPCSRCGGSGRTTCPTCGGSGKVTIN